MATTRLSDLVIPELWTPNFLLESKELTAFFASGIVVQDPMMATLANGEGSTFNLRHLNDLANDAENISSDDPSQKSTAKKITGASLKAVKCMRNQSWSSMDLVAAVHAPDPVDAIRSRIAAYWQRRFQACLVSQSVGIMAANNGGNKDMIYDHTEVGDGKISGVAIINARATMGDAADELDVIVMHSVCKANLDKQNLIQYLRDKDGALIGETYLGFRVVVDDGMPVDTTTTPGAPLYTSMLFKSGFFRMGMGTPKTPTEIERVASSGNGEGEEILYSRQQFILHPTGFSYISSVDNPANTEFVKAGTWKREFGRKQTPLAFIKTKG
ncbi:putative major head protein [Plesiomonas phage phiP4-7]|nr:putative major head protein [Plesiomonas phage phiP4-7]